MKLTEKEKKMLEMRTRLLDDIPMEDLIDYIQRHFADEMWEALAEDRRP